MSTVVVALGLAVGGLGVAHAVVTDSTADVRGVVAFVGDSNIANLGTEVLQRFTNRDDGYVPVFFTKPGAGIRQADCRPLPCPTNDYWKVRLAQTTTKLSADLFVTDLGVNDTIAPGTTATRGYSSYGAKIDWFMGLIPATRKVLWTNLPCSLEPVTRQTGCMSVNHALAQADLRWPNLEVIQWARAAFGHPEYMISPGDDVHLSAAGRTAWVALVTAEVDARLPPR